MTTRAARLVRVCRIDGQWHVLDAGGGLRRAGWTPHGLVVRPVPALPCCCWSKAMRVADLLGEFYRERARRRFDRSVLSGELLGRYLGGGF